MSIRRTSPSAKRAAFLRSGNRCPFPGCSSALVTTTGDYLGEICHIEAIARGGPRYNENSTDDVRLGPENLIVLCATHHRLVDTDPDSYSAEWLRSISTCNASSPPAESALTALTLLLEAQPLATLREAITFWESNCDNSAEEFWQTFLNNNPHVLGLALPDQLIKLQDKCYVGGKSIDNTQGNLLDFLYKSAITRNVVLIEIKTPTTRLIGPQYRGNAYAISTELTGAIVQVLNYKEELQRSFYSLATATGDQFSVIAPRCVVLAGNLEREILDDNKTRSFELFRSSQAVVILTYDELFGKIRDIADLGSGV